MRRIVKRIKGAKIERIWKAGIHQLRLRSEQMLDESLNLAKTHSYF